VSALRNAARLLLPLVSVLLVSCAHRLTRPEGKKSLIQGVTTYQQVISMYGRPFRETNLNAGTSRLIKYRSGWQRRSMGPDAVRLRGLDVLFSSNEVVEAYHFWESSQPIIRLFSQREMGTPVSEARLSKLTKNSTTRSEVLRLFGEPISQGIADVQGNILMVWLFCRASAASNADIQLLEVLFDPSGTLRGYHITERRWNRQESSELKHWKTPHEPLPIHLRPQPPARTRVSASRNGANFNGPTDMGEADFCVWRFLKSHSPGIPCRI
jgi:hypothetical protein